MEPRFAVGIDLGTTNCVMAVADLQSKGRFPELKTVPLLQRVDDATVGVSEQLPSFMYWPTDAQKKELVDFSFDANGWVMGQAAVVLGSRVKGRLVSSAKSWLCHSRVDRSSDILPWGAEEGVQKVSPLETTTLILKHLKYSWEQSEWGDHDLAEQFLTVTLPASFDQSARALTIQACEDAGLGHARLLEEPQAAFYNWVSLRKGRWEEALKGADLVLVCDVGGGTSDFSLIRCKNDGDEMSFEREAVGDHLLLGGDNIDLALAHLAESRLSGSKSKLNLSQWQLLSQLSRKAKEVLLGGSEDEVSLRLPGAGRKVIGGLRKTSLKRADAQNMILDGFFPIIEDKYEAQKGAGIQDMGLPYEAEPAVTWHILEFLTRHGIAKGPGCVLFNGGSLEPAVVRERIVSVLDEQSDREDGVVVLESDSLGEAVARGAAYYGFSNQKGGLKVGGGCSQAYYLGLDSGEGAKQVCIIPKGTEAHEPVSLELDGLEVETNRPVSFQLFQSDVYGLDEVGAIRCLENAESTGVLNTMVRFGKQASRKIPVGLEGELTELDTLQLNLFSVNTDHRWLLEFDLRSVLGGGGSGRDDALPQKMKSIDTPPMEVPEDLRTMVLGCFEGAQPRSPLKFLEKELGVQRSKWDIPFMRAVVDVFLEENSLLDKSPAYEATWMNTVSFVMRPGFGEAQDEHRRQQLWRLLKDGPRSSRDVRVNSEWYILWRRLALSLEDGRQNDIYQRNKKKLTGKKGELQLKGEGAELWRMVCSMEAMPVKDKKKWGDQLLGEAEAGGASVSMLMWCVSRLGSRMPLGGRADEMLSGAEVALWIERLFLRPDWMTSGGSMAMVELSRMCGDRHLDISLPLREKVLSFLSECASVDENQWREPIERVTSRDLISQSEIMGESLPVGLSLKG